MSDSDSDGETEQGTPDEPGPPGDVELPPQASDRARGPKHARKQARKMPGETRVSTREVDGSPIASVLEKDSDRAKGGATVKVFKG